MRKICDNYGKTCKIEIRNGRNLNETYAKILVEPHRLKRVLNGRFVDIVKCGRKKCQILKSNIGWSPKRAHLRQCKIGRIKKKKKTPASSRIELCPPITTTTTTTVLLIAVTNSNSCNGSGKREIRALKKKKKKTVGVPLPTFRPNQRRAGPPVCRGILFVLF